MKFGLSLSELRRGLCSSHRFLRRAENVVRDIAEGASEYPYLKKVAIGLAIASGTTILQTGAQIAMQPATQTVRLSTEDRKLFEDIRDKIAASGGVQSAARRFFLTVEKDPAVTEVTVSEKSGSKPLVVVPRAEFPVRSGLWTPENIPAPERPARAIWDVVLLRAPFVHVPRTWNFLRDGVPVSAKMEDPVFLAAIREGTIPITLQEGVSMRIEVEYKERLTGQVWTYVDSSRRVVRVLSPLPLASAPKKR